MEKSIGKLVSLLWKKETLAVLAMVVVVWLCWIFAPDLVSIGLESKSTREASKRALVWLGPRAFGHLLQASKYYDTENWQKTVGNICKNAENNDKAIKALISSLPDVNAVDMDGWTLLHFAAGQGCLHLVEMLIQKGANVNASNFGWTPLHWAADGGHKEVVTYLIKNGAEVNAKEMQGNTPLHCAAVAGRLDTVRLLLNNGAEPNLKTADGETVLDQAIRWDRHEIVELLRKHDAKTSEEMDKEYW